jgi:hypothetical protein
MTFLATAVAVPANEIVGDGAGSSWLLAVTIEKMPTTAPRMLRRGEGRDKRWL